MGTQSLVNGAFLTSPFLLNKLLFLSNPDLINLYSAPKI